MSAAGCSSGPKRRGGDTNYACRSRSSTGGGTLRRSAGWTGPTGSRRRSRSARRGRPRRSGLRATRRARRRRTSSRSPARSARRPTAATRRRSAGFRSGSTSSPRARWVRRARPGRRTRRWYGRRSSRYSARRSRLGAVLDGSAPLEQPDHDRQDLGDALLVLGAFLRRVAAYQAVTRLQRFVEDVVLAIVERSQGEQRLEQRGRGCRRPGDAAGAQPERSLERRPGGDQRRLAMAHVDKLLRGAQLVAYAALAEDLDRYGGLRRRRGWRERRHQALRLANS